MAKTKTLKEKKNRIKERKMIEEYNSFDYEDYDGLSILFEEIDYELNCKDYYKYLDSRIINDDFICYLLMLVYKTSVEELNSVRIEPLSKKNIELMKEIYEKDADLIKFMKRYYL